MIVVVTVGTASPTGDAVSVRSLFAAVLVDSFRLPIAMKSRRDLTEDKLPARIVLGTNGDFRRA
jgi:hypothetical protein